MEPIVLALAVAAGFAATDDAESPFYADKSEIMSYLDGAGALRPVQSTADWETRRDHVLANMQRVMGPMPDAARKVPLDVQIVEETPFPTYTRKKITFAVEDWDRLPAYLLVPKGLEARVPAVLCLHPTYDDGKDICVGISGKPHRNYAEELAERGYVTLAPDYPGFGEYKAARAELYARGYISATMKGIWNHMRCVDLLQSLPEVDPEQIGCIGHSLGGHNTLFVGAFDPRIKVMVSSCGFTAFPKYYGGDLTGWTHDGYMPTIASAYGKDPARLPFDFTEILGVLAPRYVFVNAPTHDANFEVSGVDDCIKTATPVFGLYGAEDRLIVEHPEAEHDFPDAEREKAYSFIERALAAR
ncbi:MAG TPA: alpha/beta fold hydrolase [Candidatus Hydrogenedentes bacterium]|nr:alpha/beta fold hydrolase [Candidatus Hydrogenedentota bacterium]HPG69550.1 alpha/beta fold hydrolase [Candidatus Hydrogenedentota bacterium]